MTGQKTSATFREILDAMWLFDDKFERALSKFNEIKARQKGENQQLPTGPTFAKQPSVALQRVGGQRLEFASGFGHLANQIRCPLCGRFRGDCVAKVTAERL